MKLYRRDTSADCLKEPHKKIVVLINYSSAGICFLLLLAFMSPLSDFLNIDPKECIKCQENGWIWIFVFISGIFVFYYLCHIVIAAVYGVKLLVKKNLAFKEFIEYAIFRKFPNKWFK